MDVLVTRIVAGLAVVVEVVLDRCPVASEEREVALVLCWGFGLGAVVEVVLLLRLGRILVGVGRVVKAATMVFNVDRDRMFCPGDRDDV